MLRIEWYLPGGRKRKENKWPAVDMRLQLLNNEFQCPTQLKILIHNYFMLYNSIKWKKY